MAEEPDPLYIALAHVIRLWRLGADLTQQEAYLAARLKKNTYIRLEEAEGIFSARQLSAIAAIYQKQGSELLREAENILSAGKVPELPQLPHSVREWKRRFG